MTGAAWIKGENAGAFIIPLINDGAILSATIDRRFLTAGAVPMTFVITLTYHKLLHL